MEESKMAKEITQQLLGFEKVENEAVREAFKKFLEKIKKDYKVVEDKK
ncbi:hypothetical protein [Candidatus Endomicrobiellum devescovinae]|jgi:hypothetical protein|nr:hypothetical protein [Endomicrobium sp.]